MRGSLLEEIWPQMVCFYPFYGENGGNYTRILLEDGRELVDKRRTTTMLEALAAIFATDLGALRRKYRSILGHNGLVPLPLHRDLVLVPFRVRRVQYKDHGATGYAVLDKVEGMEAASHFNGQSQEGHLPGAFASRLKLLGGSCLECMEKCTTLQKRLSEASQVKQEYSRFYWGRRVLPIHGFMGESLGGSEDGKVIYHIHYYTGPLPEGPQVFRVAEWAGEKNKGRI